MTAHCQELRAGHKLGTDRCRRTTQCRKPYPITVRNGTLRNFSFGVWAENNTDLTNITVNNLTLFISQAPGGNGIGVVFDEVSSSTVNNCTFYAGTTGIQDSRSFGGNSYNNDTFVGVNPLLILGGSNTNLLILNHCYIRARPS